MPAQNNLVHDAVSACVWQADEILVVLRAKQPNKNLWSLPGGHIEPGETHLDAIARELMEETGITARILGRIDMLDLTGPATSIHLHVFNAVWQSGRLRAGDDAAEARWVTHTAMAKLDMTSGTPELIAKAHRLISRGFDW